MDATRQALSPFPCEPAMNWSFRLLAWGGVFAALTVLIGTLAAAPPEGETKLATATKLLQSGKYGEAEEAFEALDADDAVAAALGRARCQESVGQREKAVETLTAAAAKTPDAAALPAELARLALERGAAEAAQQF